MQDKVSEIFLQVIKLKNELLCGYIAWVALCDVNSPALSREAIQVQFGEWIWRAGTLTRTEDYRYVWSF